MKNVPVIALAGTLAQGFETVYDHGIDTLFSIVPGVTSLKAALENARYNLYHTARNIAIIYGLNAKSLS